MKPREEGKHRIHLRREGGMLVEAIVYASKEIRVEDNALDQLRAAACIPTIVRVLATPDIHTGYGVPIGCVMATRRVIVPAAVGYDINCGMRLMTTPLQAKNVDVHPLAYAIRSLIPLGPGKSNLRLKQKEFEDVLAHGILGLRSVSRDFGPYSEAADEGELLADSAAAEDGGSMREADTDAVGERAYKRGISQLGTLGGGNHFIELQEVESVQRQDIAERFGVRLGQFVVMIHSGSRGFGHQVGGDYMKLAAKTHGHESPSKQLAILPVDEEEGRRYVGAMNCAANFAFANRQVMATLVRYALRGVLGNIPLKSVYDVPHNMAKLEEHNGEKLWVHRKGATRVFGPDRMKDTQFADVGQPALIPGSMGTASYLVVAGENAAESLWSVNHGAGRMMSRTAAAGRGKKKGAISDQAFAEAMKGILLLAASRQGAKEEAPQAYKDIDEVMRVVEEAGLGRAVARMRPLAVLKG